jgi:hypothetical protein
LPSSAESTQTNENSAFCPGGQRAKQSNMPGFLQGTTWVEFRQSLDEEDAVLTAQLYRNQPKFCVSY